MHKRGCRSDPPRPDYWFSSGTGAVGPSFALPLSCLLAVPSMAIAQ